MEFMKRVTSEYILLGLGVYLSTAELSRYNKVDKFCSLILLWPIYVYRIIHDERITKEEKQHFLFKLTMQSLITHAIRAF